MKSWLQPQMYWLNKQTMDDPGTHCELYGLGGVSACLPNPLGEVMGYNASIFWASGSLETLSSRRGKSSPHPTPPAHPWLAEASPAQVKLQGAATGPPLELQGVTPTGHLPKHPPAPRDCIHSSQGPGLTVYVVSSKPGTPTCTLQPPVFRRALAVDLCVCWPPVTVSSALPRRYRGRCFSFWLHNGERPVPKSHWQNPPRKDSHSNISLPRGAVTPFYWYENRVISEWTGVSQMEPALCFINNWPCFMAMGMSEGAAPWWCSGKRLNSGSIMSGKSHFVQSVIWEDKNHILPLLCNKPSQSVMMGS